MVKVKIFQTITLYSITRNWYFKKRISATNQVTFIKTFFTECDSILDCMDYIKIDGEQYNPARIDWNATDDTCEIHLSTWRYKFTNKNKYDLTLNEFLSNNWEMKKNKYRQYDPPIWEPELYWL